MRFDVAIRNNVMGLKSIRSFADGTLSAVALNNGTAYILPFSVVWPNSTAAPHSAIASTESLRSSGISAFIVAISFVTRNFCLDILSACKALCGNRPASTPSASVIALHRAIKSLQIRAGNIEALLAGLTSNFHSVLFSHANIISQDPKYYEIAKRRILQAQPPLFVDAPAQPLAVQAELV